MTSVPPGLAEAGSGKQDLAQAAASSGRSSLPPDRKLGPPREDLASHESGAVRDTATELAVQLDGGLGALRDHLLGAFPGVEVLAFRGELTLVVAPEQLLAVLAFARDDDAVTCELLADLSGVHWPGGRREQSAQETTGWPIYDAGHDDGRIEVDYVLRSLEHGHWFRVRTSVRDVDPTLPSAAGLYRSANFMEREVYDFFGVHFSGHPDLRRILMPDEWDGHPHRKDYPLGGVEVDYLGATVPPPDERTY